MKRFLTISILVCTVLSLHAQKAQEAWNKAVEDIKTWDTETMIDSLDQEKLPRVVSGGLFAGANMSQFIITRNKQTMSSYMPKLCG